VVKTAKRHYHFLGERGVFMKGNPLFYDLSILPEKWFERRGLTTYKKDLHDLKDITRLGHTYKVGSRKRKDVVESYLPTINLYAITAHECYAQYANVKGRNPLTINQDNAVFVKEDPTRLWEYISLKYDVNISADAIIFVIPSGFYAQRDLFTPHMMVHDLLEVLYEKSKKNNTKQKALFAELKAIGNQFRLRAKFGRRSFSFLPFIPKLVYYHPQYTAPQYIQSKSKTKQRIERGWFFRRAAFGYTSGTRGGMSSGDYISDLWAIWCRKEYLSPSDFWDPPLIQDAILEYGTSKYNAEGVIHGSLGLSLSDYCNALNPIFSAFLQSLKGTIIV